VTVAAPSSALDQITTAAVAGVPVLHWNPVRKTGIWGRRSLRARTVDNFGDLLGPLVVEGLVKRFGLTDAGQRSDRRLLSIGSILQFSTPGDVVWGSGVNGKVGADEYHLSGLDVRAVRGPLTRDILRERFGLAVPEVYGDPGLLLPYVQPQLTEWAKEKRFDVTIVPNLNDLRHAPRTPNTISPRAELWTVLRRIAQSRFVVGSSLHGVIVAEALGIPARAVVSPLESPLKYQDYYLGTGRDPEGAFSPTVANALAKGGAQPPAWSPHPLLTAFPADLWRSAQSPN
jgi:pyruvyltransferase